MDVPGYASLTPKAPLEPFMVPRRELGPHDVSIDIAYSGICHSDIHQAREEWFTSIFPMVPGHEIAGVVTAIGSDVTLHKVGDRVGVGCNVGSCGKCPTCLRGEQSYCAVQIAPTYNGYEMDGVTPTYGGYASAIVTDENFVFRMPDGLALDVAAPLLCAGITCYQPLAEFKVGAGSRVGIVGLGGLGHVGVKLAAAMGAEVTLISHSPGKEEDGYRFGASRFLLSSDKGAMKAATRSLDLIINTSSVQTAVDHYMHLLDFDGTMALVGLPENDIHVSPFTLITQRRRLTSTNNGGIPQTQEMLDFCGKHGIGAEIEVIPFDYVNEAWDRVVASDVKYRFVLDTATLPS